MNREVKSKPILDVRKRPTEIKVPEYVSEKSRITGWAFSKKFLEEASIESFPFNKYKNLSDRSFEYGDITNLLSSVSPGGPTVGKNYIQIWVDDSQPSSGSTADYI